MDKGLLHKYTSRLETEDQAENVLDLEATEDCGCFGYLRGLRERAVMLELRKRNGNILAIGYAWIERIEFDPSEGVTIYAAGMTVRIRGRKLSDKPNEGISMLRALLLQRATFIRDAGAASAYWDGSDPFVDSIDWEAGKRSG